MIKSMIEIAILAAILAAIVAVWDRLRFKYICARCGRRTSMPPHGTQTSIYLSCCFECAVEHDWPTVAVKDASDELLAAADRHTVCAEARAMMNDRATCHDCGVREGQLHEPGCDMERCPFCGRQLITCGCAYEHFYPKTYRWEWGRPARFTDADREHAKSCTLADWTCETCAALEAKGTNGLPASVYFDGLHDEQAAEWDRRLAEKGRVPWIQYPTICCRCGKLWPQMFRVPDEEWEKYVEPEMRGRLLCAECYGWIKRAIDEP
jgi:hypothetical protein